MAWRERHRVAWCACAATVVAVGLLAPAVGPAGARTEGAQSSRRGPTTPTSSPAPRLVQAARTGFWDCPARTTRVMVAVRTLTVRPGRPLSLSFVVRNIGVRPCSYIAPAGGTLPGPATTSHLGAGPCGSLNFEIDDDNDHNVWPGPFVFNCPALGFTQLRPGGSLRGTGTWDGTKPGVNAAVPAGRYTLVVDGHFRFPLRVVSTPGPPS